MQHREPLGRPFAAHQLSVGLANLADGVIQVGLPLVAIELTRSPIKIGMLTAAVWVPWLLFGIPAGVFVDRWDRRRTRIAAFGARAAVLAGLAAVAIADALSIWWLIGAAIAYGVTEVFADLAAQAQVPSLVRRDTVTLQRANARLLATEQVANSFLGAPVAGALVSLGVAWVIAGPAVLVTACVVVIAVGIRGGFVAARPDDRPATMRAEVGEGLHLLWNHRVLRPIFVAAGMWNFASSAFGAVILLWLVGEDSHGGWSQRTYTLAILAFPIGALLGSWLAARLLRRVREMTVIVVAWGVNGALNVLLVLSARVVPVAGFFLLVGVFGVLGNVVTQSLRQRLVPEHLLGKVSGSSRVIGYGTMPLGAVLGGVLAARVGIAAVLWTVAAIMLLATAVVGVCVPQRVVDAYAEPESARAPTPV